MAVKTYRSQRSCSQGHTERYLKNDMCAMCNRERARKQREETDPRDMREYKREYYKANLAKIKEQHEHYRKINVEKMREYSAKWRTANPEKMKAARNRWREANIDAVRETARVYRETNRELLRERGRKWAEEHPGAMNEFSAKYRKLHPERKVATSAMRRATEMKLLRGLTVWEKMQIDHMYVKARELKLKDGVPRHVDHIIPLAKGGLHVPENLQILEDIENWRKGDRM